MGEREQCPYTGRECNVQECDSCYTAREAIEYVISRQTAINWLTNEWDGMVTSVFDGIKNLPSVEPERKPGRWEMKPDPYGFFDEIPVCSECGCTTKMREVYNFCPNCGADMRGEKVER